MAAKDVYLLALHEPYQSAAHPVPINATIVHARTLLHPAVPQPDGGRMYRCLTEFPGRVEGGLVPLSTLTFELDGGRLWYEVADWEAVVEAVVKLSHSGECDAMPLGLPQPVGALLANGPRVQLDVYSRNGPATLGPADRERELNVLTAHVREFLLDGLFWPGDDLVEPPRRPRKMPYRPMRP
ncbi:hypothetical protein GCM10010413_19970 [Promicromonospora sukumoe]|uniref:Uncharacterized protein n=1 Tax=Promicromonospora sukumoe TaxID=88382 RepID=A0A7W3PE79_9MICO|nr:hypothetical protein [Promicromonospora sukumoe]MBA8808785.1 hypothetical protein [Promicromonospora sukumoe]